MSAPIKSGDLVRLKESGVKAVVGYYTPSDPGWARIVYTADGNTQYVRVDALELVASASYSEGL